MNHAIPALRIPTSIPAHPLRVSELANVRHLDQTEWHYAGQCMERRTTAEKVGEVGVPRQNRSRNRYRRDMLAARCVTRAGQGFGSGATDRGCPQHRAYTQCYAHIHILKEGKSSTIQYLKHVPLGGRRPLGERQEIRLSFAARDLDPGDATCRLKAIWISGSSGAQKCSLPTDSDARAKHVE